MTRQERMSQQRKGESKLKGIMKDQETKKYKDVNGKTLIEKARQRSLVEYQNGWRVKVSNL